MKEAGWFTPALRRKLFGWSLIALLLVYALIGLVSLPLANPTAPSGIVSFELAGTPERAAEIIASWDARAQRYAAFGLGFDYLFMLTYAAALFLACLTAGQVLRERGWPLSRWAGGLAGAAWVAAGLDAIENLGLALVLLESAGAPWPQIARLCALGKFALLFIGLVYAFFGLAIYLLSRLKPASR